MVATPAGPTLRGKVISGAFLVDPESLKLVTDPAHPLYDERVHLPVQEWLVRSIMKRGILQALIVRRNGPDLEVAVGRQRAKAAIEANRRFKAAGSAVRVRAPIIVRHGVDADWVGHAIAENEHRTPDGVMIKAAKAQRALDHGATIEEVAEDFRVSAETIHNWQRLLGLHTTIRQAVSDGRVPYTVAMRLARLPREQQLPRWKKLCRAGATNANATRVVVGGKLERVCPPSRQQLRKVADAFLAQKKFLAQEVVGDAYSFVSWVLGRISTDELLDLLSSPASGAIAEAVKVGMGARA